MENKNDISGFTLVELIVVLAILAILTAIAIPTYSKMKFTSYKATVKSDVRNLASRSIFILVEKNSIPALSPNPCSKTCSLVYGSVSESFIASKGVSLEIRSMVCPDGKNGFKIIGTYDQLPSWGYQYDSCTNTFSEI